MFYEQCLTNKSGWSKSNVVQLYSDHNRKDLDKKWIVLKGLQNIPPLLNFLKYSVKLTMSHIFFTWQKIKNKKLIYLSSFQYKKKIKIK